MFSDFQKLNLNNKQISSRGGSMKSLNEIMNEIKIGSEQRHQREKQIQFQVDEYSSIKNDLVCPKLQSNSNSNSVITQSSLQTKDCTLSSYKIDQYFDQTGMCLKDDQLLQYSPIILPNDTYNSEFNEIQLVQKGTNYLRQEDYFPLNSSNKKQNFEQFGRLYEQKSELKTILSKNRITFDQQPKQIQNDLFNLKPSFLMSSEQISPKRDESHAEKANQLIIQQYLSEIKQIQDNNTHQRKMHQTQIEELQKSNKELIKRLAQSNQDYQEIQKSHFNVINNQISLRNSSKSPDFFSFQGNINSNLIEKTEISEANSINDQENLKTQFKELQLKNKEYQLKIETLNTQMIQNKQYYENLIAQKQQNFDQKKEKLFLKCKLILSQMNNIKNELSQLKEQTLIQKKNNLEVISKIDKYTFNIVYEEHNKLNDLNISHLKNILQDSKQKLQEKQLQMEQFKEEYNNEINTKNDIIDKLEIQVQENEIEKQSFYQNYFKKQLNFENQSLDNQGQTNTSKKYTQEELLSLDISDQLQIESSKIITKKQSRNTIESSSQNTIKNEKYFERGSQPRQRQESKLEDQLKKIQLESMQKYMIMDSKINKMSVYFSERILQSDSQIQLKEMQIMHKDNQIVQKTEQVQQFQNQLQLSEQKQKRNKSQLEFVQKNLKDFVNNQSQQHQEYKRNTSQELRKLQKELNSVNLEKKKQESIIIELSQIKENQKHQIQLLKGFQLNQFNNINPTRNSEIQSATAFKVNESKGIIKDNFFNEPVQTTSMSSRQQGKKEIELKDLMKNLNSVSKKNTNILQKIGQGSKYVPVSERQTIKNKDYFNDKTNQMHYNSHTQSSNLQQSDPSINNSLTNQDNVYPIKNNSLDWSKHLLSQNSNLMRTHSCQLKSGQNEIQIQKVDKESM